MTEIEQLRADLAVLKAAIAIWQRDYKGADGTAIIAIVESKIRKLEAEAADPWWQAKHYLETFRNSPTAAARFAIKYVDHLTAENERLAKENAALGNRLEIVNRELAKSETEYRELMEDIRERGAELEKAKNRVAELERPAKAPPASLKRADEIYVGDVVLGGGEIRTISEVCKNAEESRVRLWGDGWGAWLESDELVAVVNGAMGEGETRPLKKGCDDGK